MQTKNIEILERLQRVVVQSVMRVIMEESELVQREGDVRDEKESDPSVFLSLFSGRKSALCRSKIYFTQIENQLLTSKFDFFSNRKLTLSKPKIDFF